MPFTQELNRLLNGGIRMTQFHATTILAIQHKGESAMAGDGQVTMGEQVVMKGKARKVRKILFFRTFYI